MAVGDAGSVWAPASRYRAVRDARPTTDKASGPYVLPGLCPTSPINASRPCTSPIVRAKAITPCRERAPMHAKLASNSAMLRDAAYIANSSCLATPIRAVKENEALTTALTTVIMAQIQNARVDLRFIECAA